MIARRMGTQPVGVTDEDAGDRRAPCHSRGTARAALGRRVRIYPIDRATNVATNIATQSRRTKMPAKTQRQKLRAPNHPSVRIIMAAIDRALASPNRSSGVVDAVASSIVSHGNCGEDYLGWSPEACRAVVLVHALHAPAQTLGWMVKEAKRQYEWVEWWDREGCAEGKRKPTADEIAKARAA